MMTRKIITLTLAIVMVLGIALTGCSGNTSESTTAAATTAAAAETTAAAAETTAAAAETTAAAAEATTAAGAAVSNAGKWDTGSIEVEDLGIDCEGAQISWFQTIGPGEERERVWEKMEEYLLTVYNLEADLQLISAGEYSDKMTTLMSIGQVPDLIQTGSGNNLKQYVKDGLFLDLTDYVQYCPRKYEKIKNYLGAVTFDGVLVGLPGFKDLAQNNALLYNTEVIEASGVEIPEWDCIYDLDETMYAVREWTDANMPELYDIATSEEYRHIHYCFNVETYVSWRSAVVSQFEGMEYFEGYAPGDMFIMYDTPEFMAHIKRFAQMTRDRIYPDLSEEYDSEGVYWKEGKQIFNYGIGYLFAPQGDNDFVVGIQSQSHPQMYTDYVQSCINSVYVDTQYPVACVQLMEILDNDKYIGTNLRFGLEGTHWVMQDDGRLDGTLGIELGIQYWYGVQLGDITNSVLPNDTDPSFGDALKTLNETATLSKNLGFSCDGTEVGDELSAVANVINEYLNFSMLYCSYYSDEELESMTGEFLEKLHANGVDRILENFSGQLEAWRATNG